MKRPIRSLFGVVSILSALGMAGCATDAEVDAATSGAAQTTEQRPPQFVLLAFDGSLSIPFWHCWVPAPQIPGWPVLQLPPPPGLFSSA